MMKYFIGKLGFKTKKDAKDYTTRIINSLGCCEINENNEYFTFFIDLINNHPDSENKKGNGIYCFL